MSKTGLIVEGGANRVYFAVGAMDLLMENNIIVSSKNIYELTIIQVVQKLFPFN